MKCCALFKFIYKLFDRCSAIWGLKEGYLINFEFVSNAEFIFEFALHSLEC